MKQRVVMLAVLVVVAYGCRTTAPQPAQVAETLKGIASWYGEEFAGRTTANGEIFDPGLLTAAHRTLPFGTVLDVVNVKTKQTVRVRVNDRGPYIGGRIIDLSYAAAQKIGLIEPGIGEVDITLVRMGSGDREPPVPFEATVAAAPVVAAQTPTPSDAPAVDFPVPEVPVVVDRVEVQTERAGVAMRTQVAADGKTLEEVPATGDAAPSAARYDAQRERAAAAAPQQQPAPRAVPRGQFIVQVGAFSVEENAKALQEKLAAIGQRAFIDRQSLYRVRLGPFATRDQAAAARATLEANGLSAIIVSESAGSSPARPGTTGGLRRAGTAGSAAVAFAPEPPFRQTRAPRVDKGCRPCRPAGGLSSSPGGRRGRARPARSRRRRTRSRFSRCRPSRSRESRSARSTRRTPCGSCRRRPSSDRWRP